MKEKKHIHQYQRVLIGKNKHPVMKCVLLGCSHFLSNVELAVGKESLCQFCKRATLRITQRDITVKRIKFYCNECKETIKKNQGSLAGLTEKYGLGPDIDRTEIPNTFLSELIKGGKEND